MRIRRASCTAAVTVTRFIRKMRGIAQAILAEASDGNLYVVKFGNSSHGPNLLFRESVGTELYRISSLPVPPWRAVILGKSFVDKNPGCWLNTNEQLARPQCALCFGSQYLGEKSFEILEILPSSFHKWVQNRADFWRAWLIDALAGHTDCRQAIFRMRDRGKIDAIFIDQGAMFGGAEADPCTFVAASRYLDRRIYEGISDLSLSALKHQVSQLDFDRLWQTINHLPSEWRTSSAIRCFSQAINTLAQSRAVDQTLQTMVQCQFGLADQGGTTFLSRKPVRAASPAAVQVGARTALGNGKPACVR